MKHTNFHWPLHGVVLSLLCAAPISATAADYPARQVRVVVPFPPGGGADTISRTIFSKLSEAFGQQFIIDNRGGGSGTIGTAIAAKATPDGYTILHDATGHSINPSMFAKLPYDTARDFEPVFLAGVVPNLLVMHPSIKAANVSELIALAKSTKEGLNWASSGTGSVQHMALELFKVSAGIPLNHIPYKGGGPAAVDLISGQVQLSFISAPATMPHIKSGRLRALAVTNAKRSTLLPELPTLSEAGLRGYEFEGWHGLCAPAATPRVIVDQLNSEVTKIVRRPDVIAHLAEGGAEAIATTPEVFAAQLRTEIDKWAKLVKSAGVKME